MGAVSATAVAAVLPKRTLVVRWRSSSSGSGAWGLPVWGPAAATAEVAAAAVAGGLDCAVLPLGGGRGMDHACAGPGMNHDWLEAGVNEAGAAAVAAAAAPVKGAANGLRGLLGDRRGRGGVNVAVDASAVAGGAACCRAAILAGSGPSGAAPSGAGPRRCTGRTVKRLRSTAAAAGGSVGRGGAGGGLAGALALGAAACWEGPVLACSICASMAAMTASSPDINAASKSKTVGTGWAAGLAAGCAGAAVAAPAPAPAPAALAARLAATSAAGCAWARRRDVCMPAGCLLPAITASSAALAAAARSSASPVGSAAGRSAAGLRVRLGQCSSWSRPGSMPPSRKLRCRGSASSAACLAAAPSRRDTRFRSLYSSGSRVRKMSSPIR